jgi:prophage maintenance system killer protein
MRTESQSAIPSSTATNAQAWLSPELFLNLNGIELTQSDEVVVLTWLKLAAGDISDIGLEDWLTGASPAI